MAKKEKDKVRARVAEIAKSNPNVDEKVVAESVELISYLRKIGIKPRGFNLLRSSESRLKMRPQTVYKLKST